VSVPPEFVGVWRREGIALDGAPPSESHDVLWLQAHEAFADVRRARSRVGLASMHAFAGATFWHAPELRWRHDLDWHGADAEDRGTVEWDADGFVEHGTTRIDGRVAHYAERWERLDPGEQLLVANANDDTAMLVAVGVHAIALADWRSESRGFPIRIMRAAGGGWRDAWRHGEFASLLPAPPTFSTRGACDGAIAVGDRFWHVVEATPRPAATDQTAR
jgi:Protein HRI1